MDLWSGPVPTALTFLYTKQTLRMWTQQEHFWLFFVLKGEEPMVLFYLNECTSTQSHLLFRGKPTIFMSKGKRNLWGRCLVLLRWFLCTTVNLTRSMFKSAIRVFASCGPITLTGRDEATAQRQRAQNSFKSICPSTWWESIPSLREARSQLVSSLIRSLFSA